MNSLAMVSPRFPGSPPRSRSGFVFVFALFSFFFFAVAPATRAAESFRETRILGSPWHVVGVGSDLGPIPNEWLRTIPSQAATVRWPGPIQLSAGQHPTSVTMVFWKPIEAPARWRGKAVWVDFSFLPGPTRMFLNGVPLGTRDMAGGAGTRVALTPYLPPGDSSLLVLEVRGAIAAERLLRGDPPVLQAGPTLHIDHLRARPAEKGGVLWIDAGLQDLAGAGTVRPPEGADTDEYSADFEIRSGPQENPGPPIPGGTLRSYRINPRQLNLTAPVPVKDYKPWTPDHPALYTVTATLLRNGKPMDRMTITTGFARWAIANHRLYLNDKPFPVFSLTLPAEWIAFADQGAWSEVAQAEGSLAASSPVPYLELVRNHRRNYWIQVLKTLRAVGFTMVRTTDAPFPPSLLEAADRLGMLTEQRVDPSPWKVDPKQGGGLASAIALAEAVRAYQFHPSLAFWRIEAAGGGAMQLEALARALTMLDAVRPVFAFLHNDRRVRRPGILRRPGSARSEAVLEMARLPDSTSLVRSWELYSRLTGRGRRFRVSVGWAWSPEVIQLTPASLGLAVERLLFGRANPLSGGTGLELPMPEWTKAGIPMANRTLPVDDFLWPFKDAKTSPTLASAIRRPYLMISPEVYKLQRGAKQRVEIVLLLDPFKPHPERGVLFLTLRPSKDRPNSFPASTSKHRLAIARFAGNTDVVRAGLGLDLNPELPPGPAILEAEVRWPGTSLKTGPQDVIIQAKP